MKAPIYGHPSAARAWSKTVTEWTEEFFMSNGWTIAVTNTDPCVFVILSPGLGRAERRFFGAARQLVVGSRSLHDELLRPRRAAPYIY